MGTRGGGMMKRRTFLASAALVPLALSLGACGDDRWTDYSYKMTVWVGDKPFSTVRHVKIEEGATIQSSTGRRVDRSVEGEAVIIETPSGPVFALMTPESGDFGFGQYAAYVAEPALVPALNRPRESGAGQAVREWREQQPGFDSLADGAERHRAMLKVEGPRELPRTIPNPDPYRGQRDIPVWPMFVRFGDINDPLTVREISPDSIGVSRITIAVTDENVTSGIEKNFGWLAGLHGRYLSGGSGAVGSPYGLHAGLFSSNLFK